MTKVVKLKISRFQHKRCELGLEAKNKRWVLLVTIRLCASGCHSIMHSLQRCRPTAPRLCSVTHLMCGVISLLHVAVPFPQSPICRRSPRNIALRASLYLSAQFTNLQDGCISARVQAQTWSCCRLLLCEEAAGDSCAPTHADAEALKGCLKCIDLPAGC